MRFINCTPHNINEATTRAVFLPSGSKARVSQYITPKGNHLGIPMVKTVFGGVIDLPEPVEGTLYIVSSMVFDATDRTDVVAPGQPVRDAHGVIIGCEGFRVK